jgi:putative membrane protein
MTQEFNDQNMIQERKLHPMTLLYRVFTNLPAIALPVYFAFSQGSFENWFYIVLSILALVFTVPMIILNYYYFDFSIHPKEISIRSGVFSRRQRNIPVKRIQNVNIEQNFLQRILGIAKVTLETAGNAELEGQLEFVSKKDAHDFKELIQKFQYKVKYESVENKNIESEKISDDDIQSEPEADGKPKDDLLYEMSLKEIVYHGMTRFRPVLLVVVFWLLSMAQQFYFLPQMEQINPDDILKYGESFTSDNIALLIVIFAFALLFGTWFLDILLTFNQFYRFKLFDADGKLLTDYGLLTKRHSTIPLKKLQSMTILTNPLKRKFDFFSLIIQTAGLGAARGGSADVAIPLTKYEKLIQIAKHIRKIDIPEEFNNVSRKTIRRAFFRSLIYIAPILVAMYFIYQPLLWSAVLLPLSYLHAYLRWKIMGYFVSGDNIIIKYGYIRQKITIIPIKKIQTLSVEANIFQRRLGLATLHVDTASYSSIGYFSESSIIDIDKDNAIELMKDFNMRFKQLYNTPEKQIDYTQSHKRDPEETY